MADNMTADRARIRAEASFKKPAQEAGAQTGLDVEAAERAALADKTAKLRELRLAKEKSDQIAAEVRRERRQLRPGKR